MGCGDTEYPDVYARVADVLDWITKETGLYISFLKQLLTLINMFQDMTDYIIFLFAIL